VRLAIGKAEDFSILAVPWAATFYSHLFENEHPPSQPFQNPLEVNFAPLRSVGSNNTRNALGIGIRKRSDSIERTMRYGRLSALIFVCFCTVDNGSIETPSCAPPFKIHEPQKCVALMNALKYLKDEIKWCISTRGYNRVKFAYSVHQAFSDTGHCGENDVYVNLRLFQNESAFVHLRGDKGLRLRLHELALGYTVYDDVSKAATRSDCNSSARHVASD